MTYEKMDKIKDRLKNYYETDEIDVNLANLIHQDAVKMFNELKRLRLLIDEYEKQIVHSIETGYEDIYDCCDITAKGGYESHIRQTIKDLRNLISE